MTNKIIVGLLLTAAASLSQALYLPGVAPKDYELGDDVPLFVNTISPMSTQQKSVISYDYYDERFHFCAPEGGAKKQAESLGSVLFGDRIFTSPFKASKNHSKLTLSHTMDYSLPLVTVKETSYYVCQMPFLKKMQNLSMNVLKTITP